MRKAEINRKTNETNISIEILLDGTGKSDTNTGIGFFDHMLDQLAKHSLIDIEINADGDLHIDDHHTVEDVGICLGKALKIALADKKGIHRYGSCILPMDDALIQSALDISGRAHFVWDVEFNSSYEADTLVAVGVNNEAGLGDTTVDPDNYGGYYYADGEYTGSNPGVAFVVGNGDINSSNGLAGDNPSNAFVVNYDGSATLSGELTIDSDAGSRSPQNR